LALLARAPALVLALLLVTPEGVTGQDNGGGPALIQSEKFDLAPGNFPA
jgi:hypothetical protein